MTPKPKGVVAQETGN